MLKNFLTTPDMRPRWQKQRNRAMTLIEVLVIIAICAFIMFIVVPGGVSPRAKARAQRINCVINLKQVGLAFRIWPPAQDDKYPMSVSVTNGGAMELIAAGNVAGCFQIMSNELSTPKILICPADQEHHTAATNFTTDFNNLHISYFVGLDADEEHHPQRIMTGDDNFQIIGAGVPSGVLQIQTNAPVSWTAARHKFVGNIGYADGSVAQVSDSGLQSALQQTGLATNRFAIP